MRTTARSATLFTAALVAAGTAAAGLTAGSAGTASADPYFLRDYVKTIKCSSADPWGGPRLRITVDVYNNVKYPSDGLSAPAIELLANEPRMPGLFPGLAPYTIETKVKWRNVSTGKRGTVSLPTRSQRAQWQAVLHPGKGKVQFTVHQKIGALAFVPMVNPQYSRCSGTATSV